MRIQFTKDTVLKVKPDQASELASDEKVGVKAGKGYDVVSADADGMHYKIVLANPLFGRHTYYVFKGHSTLETPGTARLDVPFFPQTDNHFQPHRTCNSSACAMVAKFLGARIDGDDDYLKRVRQVGDTTDHSVQTMVLNSLGVRSTWNVSLDFDDLDNSLAVGKPIVIGILHRGSESHPTGGHMIVVIGKDAKGDYICHDPYGSLLDGYTSDVQNGKGVSYSRKLLTKRWTADGKDSGWGRLFL